MSRTFAKLAENSKQGKGSLIGYFPIGFPYLDSSIEAAIAMCNNGVDVLELGIPYSDPVMDGPVIQSATEIALQRGFKLSQTFEAVQRVCASVTAPVLVMTYWNPVLAYGVENFARDLSEAGAAGLITPDLIPDEAGEWIHASDKFSLDRVFLAAPTSNQQRVSNASEMSRGFVYAVSTMGITGERTDLDTKAKKVVSAIHAAKPDQMAAVGIGISTAEQVRDVNQYADGAIVGSVFVKAYQDKGLTGLVEKVKEVAGGKNA
ncbi:MAG: tryptophan synthase subunit alpha [Rhodoluna sp.]